MPTPAYRRGHGTPVGMAPQRKKSDRPCPETLVLALAGISAILEEEVLTQFTVDCSGERGT